MLRMESKPPQATIFSRAQLLKAPPQYLERQRLDIRPVDVEQLLAAHRVEPRRLSG